MSLQTPVAASQRSPEVVQADRSKRHAAIDTTVWIQCLSPHTRCLKAARSIRFTYTAVARSASFIIEDASGRILAPPTRGQSMRSARTARNHRLHPQTDGSIAPHLARWPATSPAADALQRVMGAAPPPGCCLARCRRKGAGAPLVRARGPSLGRHAPCGRTTAVALATPGPRRPSRDAGASSRKYTDGA